MLGKELGKPDNHACAKILVIS